MHKIWMLLFSALLTSAVTACGPEENLPVQPENAETVISESVPSPDTTTQPTEEPEMNVEKETGESQAQILLGGQTPEDALEYMKTTPDLVIVEVNAPEWKLSNGITGALWIPYTEMAERYDEIPEDRPVLIHCGGGIVSVEAYEILQEKRPDIPELSYIAGAPPVRAYNEWLENQ